MVSRIVTVLVLASGLVSGGGLQQQPETPWPPPGVYRVTELDSLPRAIKQPRPNYTPGAMRARITGTLTLECIVQADGSVGEVRVVQSLDAQYGLDDQAVATVKQWQFVPGQKGGKAVPALVQIQLQFTLRDGPRPTTQLSWPSGFTGSTAGTADDRKWTATDVDSEGVGFHIQYPDGWKLQRDPSALEVVRITNAADTAALVLEKPRPGGPFDEPLEPDRLKAIVDRMKGNGASDSPNMDILAFGQIWGQPGRIWIWMEWSVGGRHAWRFHTGTGGREIRVTLVETLHAASAHDFALLDAVTADFGAMLRRMTMSVSP